jgi:hypothetical protein
MEPLNIPAIEQEARLLRAQEIQRFEGLIAARLGVYAQLLGATLVAALTAVSKRLRTLFSWNPQAHHSC